MRWGVLAVLVAITALIVDAGAAQATITVSTTKDETSLGDGCSLREAVETVSGAPSPDCPGATPSGVTTIALAAGVYHLSRGLHLTLEGKAAIQGAGAPAQTIIDGDRHDRVLFADSATASISNLTITGGRTRDGSDGAAGISGSPAGQAGFPSTSGGGIFNAGALTLSNVAVTGNETGNGGDGGSGFSCAAGGHGASAAGGGGIFNDGTLVMSRVVVTGNRTGDGGAGGAGCGPGQSGAGGDGGGILNALNLTVEGSTIADNATGNGGHGGLGASGSAPGGAGARGGSGAGIANQGTGMTIASSTISGNQTGNGGDGGTGGSGTTGAAGGSGGSGGDGGGLWNQVAGTSSASNSTFALNSSGDGGYGGTGGAGSGGDGGPGGNGGAGGSGGGIYDQLGSASVASSTIAANRAGLGGRFGLGGAGVHAGASGSAGALGSGGGVRAAVTLTERNSLIASNAPINCVGPVGDLGHNLSFPDSSCPHALSGDPKLGALGSYGGATQTLPLHAGSAAIDQVPASGAGCPSTDQRGVVRPRPAGGACDIGAYEFAPPVCLPVAGATREAHPVVVRLSCGDPARLAVRYVIAGRPAHGSVGPIAPTTGKVTYTPRSSFVGTDRFRYRAIDANGTSPAQTVTIKVMPVPIVISHARLTKRHFRVGTGTKFEFKLSSAARLRITIARKRLRRTVRVGALSAREPAGKDSFTFTGRIAGAPLAPGSYKATLVASAGGVRSAPVALTFAIVP